MGKQLRVAFVCLGNICRSPMAEAVFKKVMSDQKLDGRFSEITSFGTAGYHIGEKPDSRTIAVCGKHNVPINHRAQQISASDFRKYDYIICMDKSNLANLRRIRPRGSEAVVEMFGNWREDPSFPTIVEDPYYGGADGFEDCYRQCIHFSEVFLEREL